MMTSRLTTPQTILLGCWAWLGVLTGGCGNGAPAGLADLAPTDPNRLPLIPGLYIGQLRCVASVDVSDGRSSSEVDFRNESVGVGSSGLPKSNGVEVHVGLRRSFDFLGSEADVSVSSVDTFSDGVTVKWDGNLNLGAGQCTIDRSESYKRVSDVGIRLSTTLIFFCSDSSVQFVNMDDCEGELYR